MFALFFHHKTNRTIMVSILKNYIPPTITLILMLLLIGCSSNFTTETNVDPKNFSRYFSPTNVTIIESTNDLKGKYKYLGLVEGEDCQTKTYHAKPNKIAARTQARRHANQLKANAIIFTGCAELNKNTAPEQCISTIVCYAQAYIVNIQNK